MTIDTKDLKDRLDAFVAHPITPKLDAVADLFAQYRDVVLNDLYEIEFVADTVKQIDNVNLPEHTLAVAEIARRSQRILDTAALINMIDKPVVVDENTSTPELVSHLITMNRIDVEGIQRNLQELANVVTLFWMHMSNWDIEQYDLFEARQIARLQVIMPTAHRYLDQRIASLVASIG